MCVHTISHNKKNESKRKMVNFTLSLPEDIKNKMDQFPEINWSEVARESFKKKVTELSFLKGFKMDREITPAEAVKLGRELSKRLLKHYQDD
jgi:hypothetical protein